MSTKNIRSPKQLVSESGQAVVEYILVLLVVLSICLGLIWQFNDAFRKFSDNYFGNYLACLLELGELPALGGTSSGQCDSEFQAFDFSKGKPRVAMSSGLGGSSGRGGGSGGSGSDGSGSGSDGSGSGGSNKGSGSSGSGSGGNSGSGSGGSDSAGKDKDKDGSDGDGSGSGGTIGQVTSGGSADSSKFGEQSGYGRNLRPSSVVIGTVAKAYTGSTEDSNKGNTRLPGARRGDGRKNIDQSGGVIDPFEERRVRESASVQIATDSGSQSLKAQKTKLDMTRKLANTNKTQEDKKFTLADFLRWLLIAAIIIALVVFLGGQALQISKSQE